MRRSSACILARLSGCMPVCAPVALPVGRSACLPLCRTVGLSACLPAYTTARRSVGLSPRRSVGRSVAPSVGLHPPVGRPVCLPARLPVGMSVCLPLCRTVGLSACLPAYITVCLPVGLSPRRSVGRSVAARRPVAHRSSLQARRHNLPACSPVGLSACRSHRVTRTPPRVTPAEGTRQPPPKYLQPLGRLRPPLGSRPPVLPLGPWRR